MACNGYHVIDAVNGSYMNASLSNMDSCMFVSYVDSVLSHNHPFIFPSHITLSEHRNHLANPQLSSKQKSEVSTRYHSLMGPLRTQAQVGVRILDLFKQGSLIIDEVDLILHPLKSEVWRGHVT